MKTAVTGVAISPVNMSERKELGIRPGDTVRVHQKIQDKGKVRIQVFEGLVLARNMVMNQELLLLYVKWQVG